MKKNKCPFCPKKTFTFTGLLDHFIFKHLFRKVTSEPTYQEPLPPMPP